MRILQRERKRWSQFGVHSLYGVTLLLPQPSMWTDEVEAMARTRELTRQRKKKTR